MDTKNVPMVNVITNPTSIEDMDTTIMVIGGLGTTGIDMQENTHPYTSRDNITVKADT
jgi:hypothetical protein